MKLFKNSPRFKRMTLLILGVILITGFCVRAWNISIQGHWGSDGLLYYELSRGLLEDGKVLSGKAVRTIVSRSNLEFYDNLFLQGKFGHILLILVAFLFAGMNIESVLFLNLFLGTAILGAIFWLGKTVFDEIVGLTAAALAAFSLIYINYSRTALTPSGSMFFFTLGLVFFFRSLRKRGEGFVHPLFWSGLCIGYAFTIHYNLAYYFFLIYFSHLFLSVSKSVHRADWLKGNLIFACGLSLPLVAFEFGYPLLYYLFFKKHVLYSYFQEVLYNALEAGGGSTKWNYFFLYLSLAESPAFSILTLIAGIWTLGSMTRNHDLSKGLLVLFAFFPPLLLSILDFPLVGRNLAPSMPLFVVMVGGLVTWVARKTFSDHKGWACGGMITALMGAGLFHLPESYRNRSPMIEARNDLFGKPVVLIGKDALYREAILYRVSNKLSVVPFMSSLKKDPKSGNYFLLVSHERVKSLDCEPKKIYKAYDKTRFRPIRYEDNIPAPESKPAYSDTFALYDLSLCFRPHSSSTQGRSVLKIGERYAIRKTSLTSPARIHFSVGIDYLEAGYLDEAVYEFEQTILHNPKMTQAHNNLALSLAKKGRLDDALVHLEIADGLSAGMMETQNLLGLVHMQKGKFDIAIKFFEKAARINPRHPTAYQYLIHIYANFKQDLGQVKVYSEKLKKISSMESPSY